MVRITNTMLLSIAIIACVLCGQAMAGNTTEKALQKAEEDWQTFKSYLVHKKSDAVAHGKILLGKMDDEIHELEKKAAMASGDAKAAHQKEIKILKQKRSAADEKLKGLEHASKEGWETSRDGFIEAYGVLEKACQEAVAKFK